jgi:hypothetical protein
MARATVAVTDLVRNSSVASPAGTAIDATNHHALTVGTTPCQRLIIRVTNTTASTKAATIKAGDNPPADAAGQGDLSVSLTAGDATPTVKYVVLEGARFLQNDGTINIDIASGMTGFVAAYRIPQ